MLNGEILAISVQPVGFNEQQLASRYLFTWTMKVEFTDAQTNKVLWANDALTFRREYELSQRGTDVGEPGSDVRRPAAQLLRPHRHRRRAHRRDRHSRGVLAHARVATSVLRKQIASGETGPLYSLVGDDDIEKSAVAAEFAEMVDEGLRAFNVERLYGGEMKVDDLFDSASTLPMMAPRRVVIVFDAEKLLIPKRESKAADEEQERLEAFVERPPAHATVVFVCGPLDMRRRPSSCC